MAGSRTQAWSCGSVRTCFDRRLRTRAQFTRSYGQVRHAGFEGAPVPVGIDDDGRERLVFINGDVPVTPYPEWSQSDTALASIVTSAARAARRRPWFRPSGPHLGPTHSLTQRAGRSCATTTWSCRTSSSVTASPSRCSTSSSRLRVAPVYDLAQFARLCVPIDDEFDQARLGWRPADRPARLRLVADAYGLDRDGREQLLTAMDDAIDRIEVATRRAVDAGDPNAVAMWDRTGGSERFDRRRRWWMDHHDQFAAALR